jgi:N-formylglutamate amidohydrolase
MWTINYFTERLVSRHRGTLPVLISCPHGGSEQPECVYERDGSATPAGCNFEKKSDLNTRDIAIGVAQRMVDLFGEAPYVVIAEYHRKYIDANRSAACAFEADAAQPFYDEYHATLREFVDEIRAENAGLGMLFDIHGTRGIPGDPADVYLGTDNGHSVARLLNADPEALFRRRSLRGFLEAAGRTVSPHALGDPETSTLDGGFTIRTYGSGNADGIDAMQLEIINPLRTDPGLRAALIDELAFAFGRLAALMAEVCTGGATRGTHVLLGAANRPGVLALDDPRGGRRPLWIDSRGRVRSSAPPLGN